MAIASAQDELERDVAAVRRFNRFYTQKIGVLHEGFLNSRFTLAEGRVLYELAHRERPTASEIGRELGLDAGYLSRILAGFEKKRLLKRTVSAEDGRRYHLILTEKGHSAFAPLDAASRAEVAALLGSLSMARRHQIVAAMRTITGTLQDQRGAEASSVVLRGPTPGDLAWVVHRQAQLYAGEYGWNAEFETFAVEIVAAFAKNFDAARERCWIAERDGVPVGAIFLVKESDTVAKLRLLHVEAAARGLGLGRRLVTECIEQASAFGYKKLVLWTNDILHAARKIYVAEGFRLVKEEKHRSFGHDLVGQYWELTLVSTNGR
jgi:DNA-binding MarR family transcriptional regulator/N-acetylglutamate synthase-like GNAT family acetyltransferase